MADNQIVWHRGEVIDVGLVADDIARIVISTDAPHKAPPGSHIDVRIDSGDVRSYSVVSGSSDGREITLGVRLSPTSRGGSRFMHALRVGDKLDVTAPLQNFALRVGAPRYILLAGGIGVTAMAGMAAVLRRVGADYRFVYAARSRSAMAFLPELLAVHGDRLEVHLDAEKTTLDVAGLVSEADEQTEFYMCGPIRLMDAVRRSWIDHRLPMPNLRYETFGNSGWFKAEEFLVSVPALGVETTVRSGDSLLDALERAGADMMFDCRKGECGLCQVDIVDVAGTVDHRDVFFSDDQKSTAKKLCACVSRVVCTDSPGAGRLTLDVQ